ncbi:hypothetical protein [Hydrogenophaga sp.]|uniref:hypothetical protein n=1 Tax=Hydrogenophaga sp. TaxID=1904254 RepID=UPI0035AE23CE
MKTALFTLALLAQLATAQAATVPAPAQDEASTTASAPATNGGEMLALVTSPTRSKR